MPQAPVTSNDGNQQEVHPDKETGGQGLWVSFEWVGGGSVLWVPGVADEVDLLTLISENNRYLKVQHKNGTEFFLNTENVLAFMALQ